jgi:hypothetical protein
MQKKTRTKSIFGIFDPSGETKWKFRNKGFPPRPLRRDKGEVEERFHPWVRVQVSAPVTAGAESLPVTMEDSAFSMECCRTAAELEQINAEEGEFYEIEQTNHKSVLAAANSSSSSKIENETWECSLQ